MTVHSLAFLVRSTMLCALVPAACLRAQAASPSGRIVGDYVVQDKEDGMPHTIRIGRAGHTYSVQWDSNSPTTLVSRGAGDFRIAADTNTRIVFSREPDVARRLLMISAPSDTVQGLRVGPMRPGTSFDGDDWAAARGGALFDSLAVADSLLFDAFFVRCDAEATIAMYTADAEFYHDRDGLKIGAAALDAFRNNCPRDRGMRRVIVPGTVRVFGITGYGAVQFGRHRFVQSDGAPVTEAKFIQLWQRTPRGWRATKTISIDHRQQPRASR
jgi:Domain of unknown function (DUF4440)